MVRNLGYNPKTMDNLALTASLTFAGLIIGLCISIAVATLLRGVCEAIQTGSAQRKVGLIMAMVYLPLFTFLMRNMTEVLPMIIGILISSCIITIAVLIRNIRATKNPLPLPKAG